MSFVSLIYSGYKDFLKINVYYFSPFCCLTLVVFIDSFSILYVKSIDLISDTHHFFIFFHKYATQRARAPVLCGGHSGPTNLH